MHEVHIGQTLHTNPCSTNIFPRIPKPDPHPHGPRHTAHGPNKRGKGTSPAEHVVTAAQKSCPTGAQKGDSVVCLGEEWHFDR